MFHSIAQFPTQVHRQAHGLARFIKDNQADILESRGMLLVFVLLVAITGLAALGTNVSALLIRVANNLK